MTSETPCPNKMEQYKYETIEQEWNPRARIELGPIFELCKDIEYPPTPPNTPTLGQKKYYGRVRKLQVADF